MASAGLAATAYAAAGDKKNACLMAAGIAAAAVGAGVAVKAAQAARSAGGVSRVVRVVKAANARLGEGGYAALTKQSNSIAGYTRHGINQAISRDGHGVSVRAIYDAVHKPVSIVHQSGGTTKYIGKNASVVLNNRRQVVTTHAHNRNGWRW